MPFLKVTKSSPSSTLFLLWLLNRSRLSGSVLIIFVFLVIIFIQIWIWILLLLMTRLFRRMSSIGVFISIHVDGYLCAFSLVWAVRFTTSCCSSNLGVVNMGRTLMRICSVTLSTKRCKLIIFIISFVLSIRFETAVPIWLHPYGPCRCYFFELILNITSNYRSSSLKSIRLVLCRL